MVLGLFQVVASIIIACELKKFTSKVKRLFTVYSIVTLAFLTVIVTSHIIKIRLILLRLILTVLKID